VTRGYLGIIFLEDITPGLAESFGLPDQNGVLIGDVLPGTPAQKAGLESGDAMVEFNGKKITDVGSLTLMVSECSPGTDAMVKVIRDGHEKIFAVKLAELPGQIGQNANDQNKSSANSNPDTLIGVTVSDLDQPSRQHLMIPDSVHGALVTEVGPDSNFAQAGLQPGSVVVEINRQPVNNARQAVKLCTQARGNRLLLKAWRRSGDFAGTTYLSVDNTKPAN
jgi:serine protease Do